MSTSTLPTDAPSLAAIIRELAPHARVTLTGRPRDGGRDEEIAIVLADGSHRRIDWSDRKQEQGWIAYNPASTRERRITTTADLREALASLREPPPHAPRA